MLAQVAALWITAYFSGTLPQQQLFPKAISETATKEAAEQILWETALHTQFAALRYPGGFGARFPDLTFEAVPYIDMLMGDLGLEKKRKRGGWWLGRVWRECWECCGTGDYRGLVGEWVGMERRRVELEGRGG